MNKLLSKQFQIIFALFHLWLGAELIVWGEPKRQPQGVFNPPVKRKKARWRK